MGQAERVAARAAHPLCAQLRARTSASVATKSLDAAFCNINLGITPVSRAPVLAASPKDRKQGWEQKGGGEPWDLL